MTRAPHEVVLASAGTGKTFRLAKRYLELLVAEDADPGELLATTFTRKAAQEILARILHWLAQGAADDAGFATLTRDLYPENGAPAHWSRATLHQKLRAMTAALHRLQVRTLDAWFVSRAQLLGLDLGLRPDWTLADAREDEDLRLRAVAQAMDALHEHGRSELLSELQEGQFTRPVRDGLLALIDEGLGLVRDSEAEAWQQIAAGKPPDDEEWSACAERLSSAPVPRKKNGEPRKHWKDALETVVEALWEGDAAAVLDQTLVQRAVQGDEKYSSASIEPEMRSVLIEAGRLAARQRLHHLARRNRAARRLMEILARCHDEAKDARALLNFDDLPRRLAAAEGGEGRRAIEAFRSGARVRHLLLDEFQDTSVMQWRVLEPLIEELTGAGGGADGADPDDAAPSLFCVGDVKQSIYGWRQGEPRLLAGLSEWYELGDPEKMARNWRSAQTVLEVANRVFSELGAGVTTAGLDEEVARRWREGWQRHEAARKLPGAASARIVSKEESGTHALCLAAAEQARALHRDHPGARIGVLVRTNREGRQLLYELDRLHVPASGEGGSELTDSRAVQAALSLFRLADHPGHTMAAYHLAGGPFAGFAGLREGEGDWSAAARRASARLRRRILEDGPGPFLDDLLEPVRAAFRADPWERERFAQLVEMAHGFGTRGGLRPREFLRHVEATRVENPVPAPVRVMTVHAAKGLEFDAVVLPLAHRSGGGGPQFLSRRPDPRDGYEAVSRRAAGILSEFDEELAALEQDTLEREQTEALCVLYVAMTRAKRRLDLLLEEPRKNPSSFSAAELVQRALGVTPEGIWRREDEEEELADLDAAAAAEPEALRTASPRLAPAAGLRARPRWSPSGGDADEAIPGERLFLRSGEEARARGTRVHRLFEEVEWLDDFDAGDAALTALLESSEELPRDAAARAVEQFRAALEHEEVARALRPPDGVLPARLEVWREREFAVRLPEPRSGEDAILRGSFDRVVIERDDAGKPLAATITDFKTGSASDEEQWAERVAGYRGQMRAYGRALAAMTGLDEDAIRLELLFVDAGRSSRVWFQPETA